MSTNEVHLPDIGDFKDAPVIEVIVSAGDRISVDDVLIFLESDKATMDVPSSVTGTVAEVRVKVGDRISQGDLILVMEATAETGAPKPGITDKVASKAAQAADGMSNAAHKPGGGQAGYGTSAAGATLDGTSTRAAPTPQGLVSGESSRA